jgi:hypothetical protein
MQKVSFGFILFVFKTSHYLVAKIISFLIECIVLFRIFLSFPQWSIGYPVRIEARKFMCLKVKFVNPKYLVLGL